MVNRLTLVPGRSLESGVFYWEPAVDGQLLRRLLILSQEDQDLDLANLGPVGHNVFVLVHNWSVGPLDDALVLMGERPSELPDGRVPLYVCRDCGDLGCGAVTAVVERTAETVVWRDFGWDDTLDYPDPEDNEESRFSGGPFVFDRNQYDAELHRFIETFDSERQSLPAVQLSMPHESWRRRNSWWPFSSKG